MNNKLAILNSGCVLVERIDLILRKYGFNTDVLPLDTSAELLEDYNGIIISGGPSSVYDADSPKCDPKLLEADIPILGICYGMQLIIHMCGGQICKMSEREEGKKTIKIHYNNLKLFEGMSQEQNVFMSHGDAIKLLAPGFIVTSFTDKCISSVQHSFKNLFGVQFHPEAIGSEYGRHVLYNFANYMCDMTPFMTMQYNTQIIKNTLIDNTLNKKVIIFVSGGVTSLVCLLSTVKTLKKNHKIIPIHINTGFQPLSETHNIKTLNDQIKVHIIDKSQEFFIQLSKVTNPQNKKEIIDFLFKQIINEFLQTQNLNESDCVLIESTLRSNVIKSICSQDIDDPQENEKFTKIQPFVKLHKKQIVDIATEYGFGKILIDKNSFTRSGLASRIITHIDPNDTEIIILSASSCIVPVQIANTKGEYKRIGIITDYDKTIARNFLSSQSDINGCFYLAHGDPNEVSVFQTSITEKLIQLVKRINCEISSLLSKLENINVVVAWFPIGTGTIVVRVIDTTELSHNRQLCSNYIDKIGELVEPFNDISHVLIDVTDKPFVEYENC